MTLIKADSKEWYSVLHLAKNTLSRIRGRHVLGDSYDVDTLGDPSLIYALRNDIEKLGVTLEYIGTNDKELEQLRVEGCKTRAERWLRYLREKDPWPRKPSRETLMIFRKEIENACLTLKGIGSSRMEYIRFWFKYHRFSYPRVRVV